MLSHHIGSPVALPKGCLHSRLRSNSVLPDTQRHEKRNRRGLLVESNAHDSAIKNQTDDRFVLQGARVPGIPITLHLTWDSSRQSAFLITHSECSTLLDPRSEPVRPDAARLRARSTSALSHYQKLHTMDISLRDIMPRRRLRAMSASPRPERLDAFLPM